MGFSSNIFLVCSLLLLKIVDVIAQPGFISIDCGNPIQSNYTDKKTGIVYVADDKFITTGTNYNISSGNVTRRLEKQLLNVRSFPDRTRNCYKLQPVKRNAKYLIRATFMHGDYDGLREEIGPTQPLQFDLHIDINFWKTVNISDASAIYRVEAIAVALTNSISVCLINTGTGTPFISALELRQLKNSIYQYANATQYLVLIYRLNAGAATKKLIRYPTDRYDRIWSPWNSRQWSRISTNSTVENFVRDETEAPSLVMQTAVTPVNSNVIFFYWTWEDAEVPHNEFYAHLHMAELVPNVSRSFDIYLNGDFWYSNYTPPYLMTDVIYSTAPIAPPSSDYSWAINSTNVSSLPPILNALEVHSPMYLTEVATDAVDVVAINAIREKYKVESNWLGDPCAPRDYAWDHLNCSYSSISPRIVSVNLSSSALSGNISSSFSLLNELKYLDLSDNNLTGTIPDSLAGLPVLKVLDLRDNQLSGSIPPELLAKSRDGHLTLRIDGNPNLDSGNVTTSSATKMSTLVTVFICMVAVVLP